MKHTKFKAIKKTVIWAISLVLIFPLLAQAASPAKVQTLSGQELVTASLTAYQHPDYQHANDIERPIVFGRMGQINPMANPGPKVTAAIDRFATSGTQEQQLRDALNVIADLELKYGGDAYAQVMAMENGYTACQGITYLVSNLLDKTDITYRYVMESYYQDMDETKETHSGHIYLEILRSDHSWGPLECTMVISSTDQYSYEEAINYVVAEANHRQHTTPQPFRDNVTPIEYKITEKSVGFNGGQVVVPTAELTVEPVYN